MHSKIIANGRDCQVVRMWLSFIRESTEIVCVTMKASQRANFFITSAIEEEAIENQVVIQENVDDPRMERLARLAHILPSMSIVAV